jgi:hypothetical protein
MKLRQIEAIVFFISFILSIPRRKAGQEVSIPHPERLPRLMRCRRQPFVREVGAPNLAAPGETSRAQPER